MNAFSFFFKALAAKVGFSQARHHLRIASDEALLLKEAEGLVGKMTWKKLENFEDLTNEYWGLRQLDNEEKKLREELVANEKRLATAEDKAAQPETRFTPQLEEAQQRLDAEREKLAGQLRQLDGKLRESERIRKRFNGFKLKLAVLKAEGAPDDQLTDVRQQIDDVKKEYVALAAVVEGEKRAIENTEAIIETIEQEEMNLTAQITRHERTLTVEIATIRRRLVDLNARLVVIESDRKRLHEDVGHFLCSPDNVGKPGVKENIKDVAPVAARARSLSRSVSLHRRLADM